MLSQHIISMIIIKAVEKSVLPFLQIESNGTIKLLNILPTIFDTLSTGNILIVDEIENGLHPTVVKKND